MSLFRRLSTLPSLSQLSSTLPRSPQALTNFNSRSLLISCRNHPPHSRLTAYSCYSSNRNSEQYGDTPLLNEQLRHLRAVRLISETGENCGKMSGEEAYRKARSLKLDVIQVSNQSDMPILKILNYSQQQESKRRKAYEKNKAGKESKRLQKRESKLKEVRLSPVIDTNDLSIKFKKAKQFLIDGYRVRVYMMFRRGHGSLHLAARQSLIDVATQLSEFGKVQGVSDVADIAKIFDKKKQDGDDQEEEEEKQRKKPLEILLSPLPRKQRASIQEENS